MRKYYHYRVKKALTVTNLITIEHMVLPPEFLYPEESHVFHEFIYVDNGSLCCHTETEQTKAISFLFHPKRPTTTQRKAKKRRRCFSFVLAVNRNSPLF